MAWFRAVLLPVALLLALHAGVAAGRAGGGQSFHSSSSSSSSHSSYSSSSSSSGRPARPCNADANGFCEGGLVVLAGFGTLVLLFLVGFVAAIRYAGRGARLEEAQSKAAAKQSAEGAQALAAKDPGFQPAAFQARMATVFLAVQKAWNAGDLRPVRHLLSDATHERFQVLLALNERKGIRNRTEGMRILDVALSAVETGELYDTVTLRFAASCRDIDADARGTAVRDEATDFVEHWAFVRRASAKTLAHGLAEGSCPSCGAPIALTDKVACAHCHSLVASGEFDWVLAEITQASVALAPAPTVLAAAALLRTRDPLFSRQVLEDRVSALFWRLQASAPPSSDPAVGAVDLTAARISDGTSDDVLQFTVTWTAAERLHHTQMTLIRAPQAKTDARLGFNSLRCASCGGTGAGAAETCAHCGAILTDKSKDWVLTGVKAA